jgi:hypothetical protein
VSLKDTVVLERLDLSLRKEHENFDTLPSYCKEDDTIKSQRKKTLISEMNVIPFLESILETEGNTLKYLHFP